MIGVYPHQLKFYNYTYSRHEWNVKEIQKNDKNKSKNERMEEGDNNIQKERVLGVT